MNADEAYRTLAAWKANDKSVRDYLDHALAAAPVGTSISTDGTGAGRVAWAKYTGGWGPKYASCTRSYLDGEIPADKLQRLPLGVPVWSMLTLCVGTAPAPEKLADNRRVVSSYETALIVIAAMRPGDKRSFGPVVEHPYDAIVDAEDCAPFLHYRVRRHQMEGSIVYENVQLAAAAVAEILDVISQRPSP